MFAADRAPNWSDGDNCHRCRVQFSVIVRKVSKEKVRWQIISFLTKIPLTSTIVALAGKYFAENALPVAALCPSLGSKKKFEFVRIASTNITRNYSICKTIDVYLTF